MKFGLEKWIIILTVVSAALLQLIDTSIVNVTLLQMMGSLGATLGDISWVITSYAAANVVMIAMSGWLSARFGRRRFFAASIVMFTIASVLCGFSTNVWMLVAFRFLQGIGGGGLLSTAQAIIVETFPKEELGLANAIYGLGVVIGPTIGPALGGYITDHLSWHWVFFINIPVGIVATAMTLLYIKEPVDKHRVVGLDWPGMAFLIAGVGALQVVLERGDKEGWFESAYITVLSLVAAVGVVGFIWRESTTEHPVVNLKLMKSRTFAVGMLFNFILGFGLFGSVFVIPVFAQSFLGFTATNTGALLIPGSLATAVMMPIIGKMLQKKFPPHIFSGIGFLLFFVSTWMLSHLSAESGTQSFFLPLVVRGVGLGLIFIPLTTMTLIELKGRDIPQGTGLSNMIRQLGGSFGVALMATFIERRTVFHREMLAARVTEFNQAAVDRINAITQAFISRGGGSEASHSRALALVNGIVGKQASLLSYLDTFYVIGFFFLACIPLLFLFRSPKGEAGPVSGEGPAHTEMTME
ncbi:MAG: drug resistance transporter, EmrB/QacA subfamily [Fibrobacteres bacterium]|nr:drug resistance transporter, EmrB/QacA subfamily [Fibrobacterota bacterium]